MGKWTDIIAERKLPILYDTDKDRLLRIEDVKRSIQAHPDFKRQASALAQTYMRLRARKDVLKATLSSVQLRLDALMQLIVDQYLVEDATSIKLSGGVNYEDNLKAVLGEVERVPIQSIVLPTEPTVRLQFEPYTQVVDKPLNRQWAESMGLKDQLSIHWQTLNFHTKERLEHGEPDPDGVKVYAKPKIVLMKG